MLKQVIGISLLIAAHTIRNEVKAIVAKHDKEEDDADGDEDEDDVEENDDENEEL